MKRQQVAIAMPVYREKSEWSSALALPWDYTWQVHTWRPIWNVRFCLRTCAP